MKNSSILSHLEVLAAFEELKYHQSQIKKAAFNFLYSEPKSHKKGSFEFNLLNNMLKVY